MDRSLYSRLPSDFGADSTYAVHIESRIAVRLDVKRRPNDTGVDVFEHDDRRE